MTYEEDRCLSNSLSGTPLHPQLYFHLYFPAASPFLCAQKPWPSLGSPALPPRGSAGSQEGSQPVQKLSSSLWGWKGLLVLTQDISRWGFQGSCWRQFAAARLCKVPPNTSVPALSVLAHATATCITISLQLLLSFASHSAFG